MKIKKKQINAFFMFGFWLCTLLLFTLHLSVSLCFSLFAFLSLKSQSSGLPPYSSIPGTCALIGIRCIRRRFPFPLSSSYWFFGFYRCSSTPSLRFRSMFFAGIVPPRSRLVLGIDCFLEFSVLWFLQICIIELVFANSFFVWVSFTLVPIYFIGLNLISCYFLSSILGFYSFLRWVWVCVLFNEVLHIVIVFFPFLLLLLGFLLLLCVVFWEIRKGIYHCYVLFSQVSIGELLPFEFVSGKSCPFLLKKKINYYGASVMWLKKWLL